MRRIHLDTDLGSNPDDLCALAFLLSHPDVEVTGITTTAELAGQRNAHVHEALRLAGRSDIPVGTGPDCRPPQVRSPVVLPDQERYWGTRIPSAEQHDFVDVLERSIQAGATVVGIGPLTTLAAFDRARPGLLGDVPMVLQGGFTRLLDAGYPSWDIDADWNLQYDVPASVAVLTAYPPTLVPMEVTVQTGLSRADADRLDQLGALPRVMARQARAYYEDRGFAEQFSRCPKIPTDRLNFHHDPLACAVAVGWEGAATEPMTLALELEGSFFSTRRATAGPTFEVVTEVDSGRLSRDWLDCVALS